MEYFSNLIYFFYKSKCILYLRFFKVATLCLDDSFAHSWHSLNQLHEVFTWNAFKLINSCALLICGNYNGILSDGPKNTSVSISPSGEIVEGSSVTLTCSSDANPPVKRYTWYKKSGHQSISYGNTEPQQVFNQIKSSDTGEYYCDAWNGMKTGRSESINIDVKCE